MSATTSRPINKSELRAKFLDLVDATIKALERQGTWPPLPGLAVQFGTIVSYWDILELPELERLQDFLRDNEFVVEHYHSDDSEMWETLLIASLDAARSDGGLRRHFPRLFNAYYRELIRARGTWELVETITGLTADSEFRLDAQTVVTPLQRWHRHPRVAGRSVDFDPLRGPTKDDKLAVIYTTTETKKPGGPHLIDQAFPSASAFLTACRLLKPGDIRRHCLGEGQRSEFPLKETIGFCMEDGKFGYHDVAGSVEKRDVAPLRRLWKSLRTRYQRSKSPFSKRSRLEEALTRFEGTYGRQAWVDDIVDLTIATEALLSPSDQQELSYRVALRAAYLLGKRGEPSGETYKVVRTMYKIRSGTVHGTPITGEDDLAKWLERLSGIEYKFEEGLSPLFSPATEAARDVVRRLMLGCARLRQRGPAGGQTWPLPQDFEERMLDRTERRAWQKEFQARLFDIDFSP